MKEYSDSIRTFQEIEEEFKFVLDQLNRRFRFYIKLIERGHEVPSAGAYINSFQYKQTQEIYDLRRHLETEINRKYSLELVASFEAKCVYYFKNKIKKNTQFGQVMWSVVDPEKIRGDKHLMFQDMLKVFKMTILFTDDQVYRDFKNFIDFRHWLAHGRGFELGDYLSKKDESDRFDFDISYQTIFNLIKLLPKYPQMLMV